MEPSSPPDPQVKPLVPLEQLASARAEGPRSGIEAESQAVGPGPAQQGPGPAPGEEPQGREEPEGVLEPVDGEPAPLEPIKRLRPRPPAVPRPRPKATPQPVPVPQPIAVREQARLPRTGYDAWAVLVLGFALLLTGTMGRSLCSAPTSARRAA